MRRILLASLMVAVVGVLSAAPVPAQVTRGPSAASAPGSAPAAVVRRAGPPRVFVQIKGDLWRAGNGNWWSLIYVTPDGILLVDPISADFARWLKREFATRFPGK